MVYIRVVLTGASLRYANLMPLGKVVVGDAVVESLIGCHSTRKRDATRIVGRVSTGFVEGGW